MVISENRLKLQPLIETILALSPHDQLQLVMVVLQYLFKVEIVKNKLPSMETLELMDASQSSTDFWDNPYDDEDWNNA